ncbi:hypothetical protein [Soonwooa sp.]|uniref:VOC family protein n=1 Tax=Soonwooa sp. TaxID=1938592 RepID=UPI0028A98707|nr:hypothetical protein [Soonwooa sp.]
MILKEELINVMFLTEEFFETFSERPVPKGDTTQVLVAISLNSHEEVDKVVNAALANGNKSSLLVRDLCSRYEQTSKILLRSFAKENYANDRSYVRKYEYGWLPNGRR